MEKKKKFVFSMITAFLTGFFIYLCKCGMDEDNA